MIIQAQWKLLLMVEVASRLKSTNCGVSGIVLWTPPPGVEPIRKAQFRCVLQGWQAWLHNSSLIEMQKKS